MNVGVHSNPLSSEDLPMSPKGLSVFKTVILFFIVIAGTHATGLICIVTAICLIYHSMLGCSFREDVNQGPLCQFQRRLFW